MPVAGPSAGIRRAAGPVPWYRSWRAYAGLVVAAAVYIYGWHVTQIHLSELWRGARLIRPFVVALATPDVVTRTPSLQQAAAPYSYGGAPAPGAAGPLQGTGAGASLRLSRGAGASGDRVTVHGEGFGADRSGALWWENQIGQRQQLATFRTDAQGRFDAVITTPDVQGTRNQVIAEVVTGYGPLRPSQTLLVVLDRMVETVFLALMGTTMGVVFAVPLSFLGARNLTGHLPAGGAVYALTRTLFNLTRSIEALVLAIIFTVWVGLGPFAGVLALGVHSIASLGKLYSEAIESIDTGPIEAIMATGASTLQVIRYAVVPQIVPQFIAFTIYRWDINVRFSTVIGFVGGGGIGFVLQQYINLLQWPQAATALWMIALVVAAMDYASAVVRERIA
ncbi:MAG TPA: phosphonate ABC transporter, permease protein PhnE [bacterium]|nr:phosphonate ABC transporter, permease protein PhnE [bacterium]